MCSGSCPHPGYAAPTQPGQEELVRAQCTERILDEGRNSINLSEFFELLESGELKQNWRNVISLSIILNTRQVFFLKKMRGGGVRRRSREVEKKNGRRRKHTRTSQSFTTLGLVITKNPQKEYGREKRTRDKRITSE